MDRFLETAFQYVLKSFVRYQAFFSYLMINRNIETVYGIKEEECPNAVVEVGLFLAVLFKLACFVEQSAKLRIPAKIVERFVLYCLIGCRYDVDELTHKVDLKI